jgi:hypothetical protein
MKTEAELWKDIKRKTASEVHWTRIEARVGAGVPDINGAFQRSSNGRQMGIEIWCELKVCKTKRYKTAGLWRPAQIAWQTARSKYCATLWNLVSHPQAGVVKIYNAQKIAGLWDDETGNLEPDQILEYGTTWSAFLDLAATRAFGE